MAKYYLNIFCDKIMTLISFDIRHVLSSNVCPSACPGIWIYTNSAWFPFIISHIRYNSDIHIQNFQYWTVHRRIHLNVRLTGRHWHYCINAYGVRLILIFDVLHKTPIVCLSACLADWPLWRCIWMNEYSFWHIQSS